MVRPRHWNLMITSVSIEETHSVVPDIGVDHLVDLRERETVLMAVFVEVGEVHIDFPLSSLLFDHHCVSQPLRVMDFPDRLSF